MHQLRTAHRQHIHIHQVIVSLFERSRLSHQAQEPASAGLHLEERTGEVGIRHPHRRLEVPTHTDQVLSASANESEKETGTLSGMETGTGSGREWIGIAREIHTVTS